MRHHIITAMGNPTMEKSHRMVCHRHTLLVKDLISQENKNYTVLIILFLYK